MPKTLEEQLKAANAQVTEMSDQVTALTAERDNAVTAKATAETALAAANAANETLTTERDEALKAKATAEQERDTARSAAAQFEKDATEFAGKIAAALEVSDAATLDLSKLKEAVTTGIEKRASAQARQILGLSAGEALPTGETGGGSQQRSDANISPAERLARVPVKG